MSDPSLFSGGVGDPLPRSAAPGVPRLQRAERTQSEIMVAALEDLLPPDHRARVVWAFVVGLDLSCFANEIQAVEGHVGRPATDPAVLVTLWLLATLEGVGSARALDRLCNEHIAYRWVCGGVGVNYHTLSDFRVCHGEKVEQLLVQSVTSLMHEGLVDLTCVAQDGLRVRAEAGKSSFHRKPKLETMREAAEEHVRTLRRELEQDPTATTKRQRAARERAARESKERIEKAIKVRDQLAAQRAEHARTRKTAEEARASTTDPEARRMKMPDGGSRPAYNSQFASDAPSGVVVGVAVTNIGNDGGQMGKMVDQIEAQLGKAPKQILVDGGYVNHEDITETERKGTTTYAPVRAQKQDKKGPYEKHANDTPEVWAWRQRMATAEGQAIYAQRPATAELTNAMARNRGLQRVFVRGLTRVKAVLLWFALAHNCLRAFALRAEVGASA